MYILPLLELIKYCLTNHPMVNITFTFEVLRIYYEVKKILVAISEHADIFYTNL